MHTDTVRCLTYYPTNIDLYMSRLSGRYHSVQLLVHFTYRRTHLNRMLFYIEQEVARILLWQGV